MRRISVAPTAAIVLRVGDQSLHPYMQRYPLLSGPDASMNWRCLAAIREGIEMRKADAPHDLELLDPADVDIDRDAAAAAKRILDAADAPANTREQLAKALLWKMPLIPVTARSALAFGCGDGVELAMLRARLPQADIHAVDWTDGVAPSLKKATDAHVSVDNMFEYIRKSEKMFDVIFANHVIEHFYDPEDGLRLLGSRLAPGGVLVAALPLEGSGEGIFADTMVRFGSEPRSIKSADMIVLNAGHPWKTNVSDLGGTLRRVGFSSVTIRQRRWHPTVTDWINDGNHATWRRRSRAINTFIVRPWERLVGAIFPDRGPALLLRILAAVERRLPFGSHILLTRDTPEVVFVAGGFSAPAAN